MNLLKLFCRPTLTEELSEALIFQQRKVMLYELAAIEASANETPQQSQQPLPEV